MVAQSDVFWKAFIVTLVIFITGILMGFWIDDQRVQEIRAEYKEMDIRVNDARMQSLYYQVFRNSSNFCEPAIEENLKFADKVYAEGIKLEQYERVNKLTPSLVTDKRRYVLLKLQFWLNCIELKRACNANYTNLVYFYSHYNTTMEDYVQSAALSDFKKECGRNIMLIPLPTDLNITTIDILKEQYNITVTPTLLIDEEEKVTGLVGADALREHVRC
jgi:hypothetical protein